MANLSTKFDRAVVSKGEVDCYDSLPAFVRRANDRRAARDAVSTPPIGSYVIDASAGPYYTLKEAWADAKDATGELVFWFADGTHDVGSIVHKNYYQDATRLDSTSIWYYFVGDHQAAFSVGDSVTFSASDHYGVNCAVLDVSWDGTNTGFLLFDDGVGQDGDNSMMWSMPKKRGQKFRFLGKSKADTVVVDRGLSMFSWPELPVAPPITGTAYKTMAAVSNNNTGHIWSQSGETDIVIVTPGLFTSFVLDGSAEVGDYIGWASQFPPGCDMYEITNVSDATASIAEPYSGPNNFIDYPNYYNLGDQRIMILKPEQVTTPANGYSFERLTLVPGQFGETSPFSYVAMVNQRAGRPGSVYFGDVRFRSDTNNTRRWLVQGTWPFSYVSFDVDFCDFLGGINDDQDNADMVGNSGSCNIKYVCCTWDADFNEPAAYIKMPYRPQNYSMLWGCKFGENVMLQGGDNVSSQMVNCDLIGTDYFFSPGGGSGNFTALSTNSPELFCMYRGTMSGSPYDGPDFANNNSSYVVVRGGVVVRGTYVN